MAQEAAIAFENGASGAPAEPNTTRSPPLRRTAQIQVLRSGHASPPIIWTSFTMPPGLTRPGGTIPAMRDPSRARPPVRAAACRARSAVAAAPRAAVPVTPPGVTCPRR
jgi:hypothetical protein